METLSTIATNAITLWNAPIDWSPTAGPIWLAWTTALMVVYIGACLVFENRREKAAARRLVYAEAQKVVARRLHLMETQGYVDTRSF
jgi:hypothetical protein